MQAILCLSGTQKRAEPPDDPLGRRRLQESLCDQRPGACAEARPRPGARADLEEAVDGGSMPGLAGEGTRDEVLVERQRARIWVALLEIDVRGLEIRRRKHDTTQDRGLEVRNVPPDPRLDPVGVALAQRLVPRPVPDVQLACRVAFHVPRELLQLDPEDAFPGRPAR